MLGVVMSSAAVLNVVAHLLWKNNSYSFSFHSNVKCSVL
jgi:hypothetical protein